ncbi:MAG: hypothetical protein HZB38_11985 [Planctomycetes bacterium]|nr:hypothetical protein [Planctomycetota bacterium]
MTRFVFSVLASGLLCAASLAQSTTTTTESLADNTPTENLQTASGRNPGRIVNDARARHLALRDARLAYQHGSGSLGTSTTSGSSSSSTSTGTSTDINNMLGSLLGSGGLNSIGSLLGQGGDLSSLLGLAGGSTGTTTGTSGSSDNSNIPPHITPEVIAMLQAAGININDVFPPSGSSSTQKSSSTETDQTKTDIRAQTATSDQPRFAARWGNAMLSTIFTSLTVGVRLPEFVNLIEKNLRPILRPDTVSSSATAKTSSVKTLLTDVLRAAPSDAEPDAADAVENTETE